MMEVGANELLLFFFSFHLCDLNLAFGNDQWQLSIVVVTKSQESEFLDVKITSATQISCS